MMPSTKKPRDRERCGCACCSPNQQHCQGTGCSWRPVVSDGTSGQLPDPRLVMELWQRQQRAPKTSTNAVWDRKVAKQRRREAFSPLGRPRRK